MLGSLARWLRILGYDVTYDSNLDDADLVERAVREKRIILTRDRRLVERKQARNHLLVDSERLDEQIHQVLGDCGEKVEPDRLFGRCVRCNQPLSELSPEEAADRVPPYVARTQNRFHHCFGCNRVYWRATHVERMLSRLEALGLGKS
jgi:uncharacterized protein with PIN domain